MHDDLKKPDVLTPATLKRWLPALYRHHLQYRFYKSTEWIQLRKHVLEKNHYECEDCRAKSPTVIRRATCVHHDRETKFFPEFALSEFWIDSKGEKHQNLFALCDECHNRRHERFGFTESEKEPLTPERW